MLVETEWRFVAYKRWSVDAFTGTGKAFTSFEEFGPATWVYNYGFGVRYELAKKYGMNVGIDFAWSNNKEFAFYIIVGTAWNK
jgi:outer membrane translocation and assembly module TamA